jgi:hypothetical protein
MPKGSGNSRRQAPAETPEAREQQLINLAMNAAEEKLRNGTASNSIIVHFLKLGTAKAELEKAKLQADVELAEAKTEGIRQQARIEEVYSKAIEGMKTYQGNTFQEEYYDDEDDS